MFPDQAWNSWTPGQDGEGRFVGVNAIRIGPDGALWVVDRGAAGLGGARVAGGPKLVRIDLETNAVSLVYDLGAATAPWSFVDDVRFNGSNAYLTDAGQPGLIVLDLETGAARRLLDGHPSTIAQTPLRAEGEVIRNPEGAPINIHADHLEVSADGRWFYFQPANGGMARIETRWLDDPAATPEQLAQAVETFAATPPTGGTAIAADGQIYLADVDRKRILAISTTGEMETVVEDPRLVWVDAMWISDDGKLLMPASQLNRTPGLNGGRNAVEGPVSLFAIDLGASPVRR